MVEDKDSHGTHAAQFDLLEYSRTEVCVAYSLGLPGQASSIALSLPAHQHRRLITAARSLSARATGILLAHLIADDRTVTCHLKAGLRGVHCPNFEALPRCRRPATRARGCSVGLSG